MERNIFPHDSAGRIPIVAVTGNRARDAGRCLAALLTDAGYRVGRASLDGVFFGGLKINLEDATAHEKARAVLENSLVEAAILECDGLDLLREGFRCDVALLTGRPEADDYGAPFGADTEDVAEETNAAWLAVLQALAPDGKAVLNADDPPSPNSALPPADRLIWFAQTGENEHLSNHRASGGTTVFLCADSLVVARGTLEQRLPFGGRPVERGPREQLALLAALAGAMALNLCGDEKPSTAVEESETLEAVLSTV